MEMRHQRINNTTYHEALLGLGVGQLAGAVATLWVGPLTGIATTAVVAGVVAGSLSWYANWQLGQKIDDIYDVLKPALDTADNEIQGGAGERDPLLLLTSA